MYKRQIYDFGRIEAQRVALESVIEIEKYRGQADLLDVDLLVREAYFAVQGAKAIGEASMAAYTRAKTHRDFAQASVDQKLRPNIELTRAEADLTRFDVGRLRAQGGIAIAQSVFGVKAIAVDPRSRESKTSVALALTSPRRRARPVACANLRS